MKARQKKLYIKLFAAVTALMTAVAMVMTVSYAWLTISTSPEVSGAQVMIGGGKTILLAPDLTETVSTGSGDVVVHYPGAFSTNLRFSQYDSYDYLRDLSGLEPVSTADGLVWILPTYDAETGRLNSVSSFLTDDTLSYANGTTVGGQGGYIYLDFWVVSPGSEYYLRASMDMQADEGSALIELPAVANSGDSGFTLEETGGEIASIARVGFLTDSLSCSTAAMVAYTHSEDYNELYRSLRGVYPDPGETPEAETTYSFTIYEPNGTLHPDSGAEAGSYQITRPLGYDSENGIAERDIRDILTVQTGSSWRDSNESIPMGELLQTALAGRSGLTAATAWRLFYGDYLQWQLSHYIESGRFFQNTAGLYAAANAQGHVTAEEAAELDLAGATDDVWIVKLERNIPQRIRMYIWLEGQDADCRSAASAASFALSLELAGGSRGS